MPIDNIVRKIKSTVILMEIFRHQFSPARKNFYGILLAHVIGNGNARAYPDTFIIHNECCPPIERQPCQPIVATFATNRRKEEWNGKIFNGIQ